VKVISYAKYIGNTVSIKRIGNIRDIRIKNTNRENIRILHPRIGLNLSSSVITIIDITKNIIHSIINLLSITNYPITINYLRG